MRPSRLIPILIVMGSALAFSGNIEPDECYLREDQVEVIGPRYGPEGADILWICGAGGDWAGMIQQRWYSLPPGTESVFDLHLECRDQTMGSQDVFAVKKCLAQHLVAVAWQPHLMGMEETRQFYSWIEHGVQGCSASETIIALADEKRCPNGSRAGEDALVERRPGNAPGLAARKHLNRDPPCARASPWRRPQAGAPRSARSNSRRMNATS